MDYFNPRGTPFTSEDVIHLLRSLSRIPVDPENFEGEEKGIAQGLQSIQKRVEESISLYEARTGTPLSHSKRELLTQTLTAKLLHPKKSAEAGSLSHYLERTQKSFEELLKLSQLRNSNRRGSSE
jgi:hypothetical protein